MSETRPRPQSVPRPLQKSEETGQTTEESTKSTKVSQLAKQLNQAQEFINDGN